MTEWNSEVPGSTRGAEVLTYLPDVDAAWPSVLDSSRRLCEEIGSGRGGERTENAFEDLVDLLVPIFRREESFLRASNSRELEAHRRGHLSILKLVADLRGLARESGGSPILGSRARRDLLEALDEHHVVLDALLGRHVRAWVRSSPSADPWDSLDSEP